jgi:dynein heavy chain
VRKKPKEWIPDAVWLNIVALSNMDAFRDIPDSVFRNDGLWRQWYDQEAPEMAKVGMKERAGPSVWKVLMCKVYESHV